MYLRIARVSEHVIAHIIQDIVQNIAGHIIEHTSLRTVQACTTTPRLRASLTHLCPCELLTGISPLYPPVRRPMHVHCDMSGSGP